MKGIPPLNLQFRRNIRIGEADAEQDSLLHEAFWELGGGLEVLEDTRAPRSVVVGRTGTGKTALLMRLEDLYSQGGQAIRVKPETLSMQYLSNSTILPVLTGLGVHLDLFYKLLWRHIFVVELIRKHWDLSDPEKEKGFFTKLQNIFSRDPTKEKAIEYLRAWGPQFWIESDRRVVEVVQTLEKKVEGSMGSTLSGLQLGAGGSQRDSREERAEVKDRAQKVVNGIQLTALEDAMRLVKEDILSDDQHPYFFLVDDLDKNWVDSEFTYDLIDALLQEVYNWATVANVKVVVALRENLLQQVYRRYKRRPGQQREKYETLCLRLKWSREDLVSMLNLRLDRLFKEQVGKAVTLGAILPRPRGRGKGAQDATGYLLDRTFLRPRDIIHFVNACLEECPGKPRITWAAIGKAEARYSRERLQSIEDEWQENYPGFEAFLRSLSGFPASFGPEVFDDDWICDLLAQGEGVNADHSVLGIFFQMFTRGSVSEPLREFALGILFQVGAIGVKLTERDPVTYSYTQPDLIETGIPDQ